METNVLAGVLHSARQLTRYYLSKAEGLDTGKRFHIEGFDTCNIHWLVAHLAWGQDFLILRGVGNSGSNIPWLKHFELGSTFPDAADFPPYDEALNAFNELHQRSIDLIKTIDPITLDEPNHIGLKFGPLDDKRTIIQHAIRHEGMHCGHLGWLLRMHGRKVI